MKWNYENNIITNEMIKNVETQLGIVFPHDFINTIKKYDGGYPVPNKLSVNENEEVLNNIISFKEGDESYIIDIINDTEYLSETNLIPIAEDPFGNLFCYKFEGNRSSIVFWNHEKSNDYIYVCDTFEELLFNLH